MFPLAATSTLLTSVSLLAVIGAIVGGFVAVRKLGPERDALYITSAQGAAVILDNLVATLREEVERCRTENRLLTTEVERLRKENGLLVADNDGLRQRHGTRRTDHEPS